MRYGRPVFVLILVWVVFTGLPALAAAGWQEPAEAKAKQEPGPEARVVITLGEQKITAADVERFLEALPPQYRAFYGGQGRHLLPQYLVRMRVLAEEARKQNLQEMASIRQALEIAADSILADAARAQLAKSVPVREEQVQKLYQEKKAAWEEVQIRRILIRTETSIMAYSSVPSRPPLSSAEAHKKLEGLHQQILQGADFAELAQAESDDLATAGSGGDMGYTTRDNLVPPIAEAAFRLKPGETSEIIPTPYGLELIQVVGKRTRSLGEVRSQLEEEIRRQDVEARIQELVNQRKITVDTGFFSPSPTTPPPTPTHP